MTRYLLDTDVAIELMRGRNDRLLERLAGLEQSRVALSAVTIAELYFGASLSQQATASLARCRIFCRAFRILPLTRSAAEKSGEFRARLEVAGRRIGAYDLLIAATAFRSGAILVTHNTREFSRIAELQLEDWTV